MAGLLNLVYEENTGKNTRANPRHSHVTGCNPSTGRLMIWEGAYDHQGKVNRVHSKMVGGGLVSIFHYSPAKSDIGQGLATPDGQVVRPNCRWL